MENYSLLAAEYGFFLKMSGVAVIAILAGILLRKKPSAHHEAD